MFCPNCGTQNPEGASFCSKCGSSLAPAQQNAYYAQAQQTPMMERSSAGVEGNVGAAWRDITGHQGWFKRILILCLIGCVPILNFAVEGYCIRWARELSFGHRAELPKKLLKKKEISTGFFAWLVKIGLTSAFGIIMFLATTVLSGLFGVFSPVAAGVITIILTVAFWVFEVFFFNPVVDASVVRMSVVGYLESGFNFSCVWRSFRKNMGGLIGASILPRLVVWIVGAIIIGLITFIVAFAVGASFVPMMSRVSNGSMMYGNAYRSGSSDLADLGGALSGVNDMLSMIMGLGTGIIAVLVIMWILISLFYAFSTLFTYRAVGHWVARTAPEWAEESDGEADGGDTGGIGFNSVIPAAPTQPPLEYESESATEWHSSADWPAQTSDFDTTALADVGPRLSLERKSTGRLYEMTSFPATIGKGSAANVRIEDNNSISRVHARISYTGSAFVVEDLGATNRTYLNGECVSEGEIAVLHDGDELKLAEEPFIVKMG